MGRRGRKPMQVTDTMMAKVMMYRALGYTQKQTMKAMKVSPVVEERTQARIDEELKKKWPIDVFKRMVEPLYRRI